MKHRAKRIISILCALAMCGAMVPAVTAFAQPSASSAAETVEAAQVETLQPGSSTLTAGEQAVLQGTVSEEGGDSWRASADGGYDADGIQILSGSDTNAVTIQVTKAGIYNVRHTWNTGLSWPMSTDSENFRITVSAEQVTVGELEFYTNVQGVPYENGQAVPTTLHYTLHYRGTAAPTSSGNFDSYFAPIAFTATVDQVGTDISILPAQDQASKVLIQGYYRLDYDTTGNPSYWDAAAIHKDEAVYLEVTEDNGIRFVTSGGKPYTNDDAGMVESILAADTCVLTFDAGEGTAVTTALSQQNQEFVLPTSTREGYELGGWTADVDGKTYQAGKAYTVTGDTAFTAYWTVKGPDTDPVDPTPGEEDGVSVDKTATDLVNVETNVTLTVGGQQQNTVSDVVFVLDKSASLDIRQEAMNMLDELKAQAEEGNLINVGVVNFESGVLESMPLTQLTEENLDTIRNSVEYINPESSGTNIYAGLAAGEAMLDADTAVAAENKHLVLVSDGVTYLWGDGQGNNIFSIYSENTSNGEENLYASHETIDWHHPDASYYDEFTDLLNWYNANSADIAADMQTYQNTYDHTGQYKANAYGVTSGQGTDTDWSVIPKFAAANSYVPAEEEENTASAADAAIYMVAREWIQIAQKYNAYAYADPRYQSQGKYIWAYNAISNLSDLGDFSSVIPATVDQYNGMFDAVKSTVLYDINQGTVKDVIGDAFDLTDLSSFALTVGGVAATKEVNGNTITFNGGDYVVTYYPATEDQAEYFTWEIKVPVESTDSLQLTYTLTLVDKSTVPGDYTEPTNEEAVLDYTSTTGETGEEPFPVPEVTYTVPETDPTPDPDPDPDPDPTPDPDPGVDPDPNPGTDPDTDPGTETPSAPSQPSDSTTSPQTDDNAPLGLLTVVVIVSAGALGGLMILRKRREQ